MKTLSVVLAVFNEEKNLDKCLQSVRGLADEIIVVDGSSTDKTVEIAKKYGVKIVVTDNPVNFHINKQKAIDLATKDWILQLDADERVSSELAQEIKEKIVPTNSIRVGSRMETTIGKNSKLEIENSVNGYWIPRKNWFLSRFLMKGGQYPDYTLRLYKRGKGKLPQKDVHEQAMVEGKIGYLKQPLLHFPYRNFLSYIHKWNRYNDFLAKQIREDLKSKDLLIKVTYAVEYLTIKPIHWFLASYIRHKGFMDLWPGFVFSIFSSLRFAVSYIKYATYSKLILVFILSLSIFLRFFNFANRWGLASDQARDAIVSYQALITHQLPLIGPFSASGPFVFGPHMYWIYMLITAINPSSILFLWIIQAAISSLMPLMMYFIGKEIANKKFGLLIAFFTAISTGQVTQSTNLTYSTFVGFISIIVFLFTVKVIKSSKDIYFFLLAFFIGLAVNIHFQAIGLLFVFFTLPLFSKFTVKRFLMLLFGFIIPFTPLVIFDFISNHFESKHLLSYFFSGGGGSGSLPKRWLTYIGTFWSNAMSLIIGGNIIVGYLEGLIIVISIIYSFWKKSLSKIISFVLVFLLINILFLRYFKGQIFDAFLVYLHPAIFILLAWAITKVKKISIYAALLILLIITSFTLLRNFEEIKNSSNLTAQYSVEYVKELIKVFPGKKFAFYDYSHETTYRSYPLIMYLMKNGLIDDSGRKVGLATATNSAELKKYNASVINKGNLRDSFYLLDLEKYGNKELISMGWSFVNPSALYDSIENWYKKISD